ncbi:hypothetical protein FPV67DRAFT_1505642 [Lyophyllum atratum]|nr:hypothetical protein FPV67DRAFT_1505642 [Lyophyllum atratum]
MYRTATDNESEPSRDHATIQPIQQQQAQQSGQQQQPAQHTQHLAQQQPAQQQLPLQQASPSNDVASTPAQPFSYTASSARRQTVLLPRSADRFEEEMYLGYDTPREYGHDRERMGGPPSPVGRDRDRMGSPTSPVDTRPGFGLRTPPRTQTFDSPYPAKRRSPVDHKGSGLFEEKAPPKRTFGERLAPTLATANVERNKYAMKAKMTGYTLNAAIGAQVLLGSLTTGLSATAITGRQAAVATTVLGGLLTLVASYLARARGSNEPELSITRVKDLEHFIRECEAFQLDNGHVATGEHDKQLFRFRSQFEELVGNANGERKLASLV